MRKLSLGKKIAFSIVPTVALLGLVELGLRAVGFYYNPHDLNLPVFERQGDEWHTSPHYLDNGLMKAVRAGSGGPIEVDLVRRQTFPAVPPANAVRLVLIGGSTVHDWGMAEPLVQALSPALGRPVEVVNFGIPGCGSEREVLSVAEATQFAPNAIVLYTGHNEFLSVSSPDSWLTPPRGLCFPYRQSRLLQAVWMFQERARAAGDPGSYLGIGSMSNQEFLVDLKPCRVYLPADKERVYQALGRHLRQMAETARAAQIPIVLCSAPYSLTHPAWSSVPRSEVEKLNTDSLKERLARGEEDACISGQVLGERLAKTGHYTDAKEAYEGALLACQKPLRADRRMNAILAEVANSYQLPLVPLKAAIDAKSPHGIANEEIFFDQCHMRPPGHEIVFRALAAALVGVLR